MQRADGRQFTSLREACAQLELDKPFWDLVERQERIDYFSRTVRVRLDPTVKEVQWQVVGDKDWQPLARPQGEQAERFWLQRNQV
jgi:hypothetical protein